jgi:hypothetical protein
VRTQHILHMIFGCLNQVIHMLPLTHDPLFLVDDLI